MNPMQSPNTGTGKKLCSSYLLNKERKHIELHEFREYFLYCKNSNFKTRKVPCFKKVIK